MDNVPEQQKPESFLRLEDAMRTIFAAPKSEVDALEKQAKQDKKKHKPSK